MIGPELIFFSDLIAILSIYLIINLSLNLEFGYAGIPNFGKVLSVAAGAFVAGIIPINLYGLILGIGKDPIQDNFEVVAEINSHISMHPEIAFVIFAITVIVAMVAGGVLGLLSSYPALRLRGDYLAMTLLGFGELIRIIGINHTDLVGGTLGVSLPDMLSFVPNDLRFFIASMVLLCFAIAVYFLVSRFTKSPVGRLLRAMRDDELAARSLGRNIVRIKMKILLVSGMIGAVGGLLYAMYVEGVVAFGYNRLNWTFLPFLMLIVGGTANNKGVLAGTVIFVLLRKLIVYYNDGLDGLLPFDIIWLDYLLLGGIMITVLLFKPHGIFSEKPGKMPKRSEPDVPGGA